MNRSINLYLTESNLNIEKDPNIVKLIQTSSQVKRIIELAKKHFTKGLNDKEKEETQTLFKDPKVEQLLKAAEKVGEREGWIKGGFIGTLIGLFTGGVAGAGTDLFFAAVLLGAVLGGVGIGYLGSKIYKILKRWELEERITRGDTIRIHT